MASVNRKDYGPAPQVEDDDLIDPDDGKLISGGGEGRFAVWCVAVLTGLFVQRTLMVSTTSTTL